MDGPAGQIRLYAAHAGTAVVTRLDNNTLCEGEVKSWQVSPDGGKIAYLADQTTDESLELFAAWGVPSTPSNWPDRSGPVGGFLPALNYVISDAETPSALLTISAKSSNQALIVNLFLWSSQCQRRPQRKCWSKWLLLVLTGLILRSAPACIHRRQARARF